MLLANNTIKSARNKVMMRLSAVALFVFNSVYSISAFAADMPEAVTTPSFDGGMNFDSLLQVLTGLISVILIIFLLSLLLKKFNIVPGGSSGIIKVVSGLALNSKDRLMLVQVGEEQILLSVTPGNISKLHKLETPVVLDDLPQNKSGNKNFSSLLKTALTGQKS